MAMKDTVGSPALKADLPPFLNCGQEQTGAALVLQKELLASYEQVNRVWLARVQSDVGLWSDLATKLTATKTVPEALEAYAKCVSERMKMAVDDSRLLAGEAQQITQKITNALGNGWLNRGQSISHSR